MHEDRQRNDKSIPTHAIYIIFSSTKLMDYVKSVIMPALLVQKFQTFTLLYYFAVLLAICYYMLFIFWQNKLFSILIII